MKDCHEPRKVCINMENKCYHITTDRFILTLNEKGVACSLKHDLSDRELLSSSGESAFLLNTGGQCVALDRLMWEPEENKLTATSPDNQVAVAMRVKTCSRYIVFEPIGLQGISGCVSLTMRLELAIEGLIGERIATVHGDDAVGLQGLTPDCSGYARRVENGPVVCVSINFAADNPIGGIALFACTGADAMATIGHIEIEEGLPHPEMDGMWAKESPSMTRSYFIADFTPDETNEIIDFVERAGLRVLYLPPWIWGSKYGHFGVNESIFPNGENDLYRLSQYAHSHGITIGAHTLSAWISPDDSYVTPIPHEGLAVWSRGVLAEKLSVDSSVIRVRADSDFTPASIVSKGEWYKIGTIRIGDELIRFERDEHARDLILLKECSRGAYGTFASEHQEGESVHLMVQAYGHHFVPAPNSQLLFEQAGQLADIMNRCKLGITSFDGLETLNFCGDFGMNQFVEAVFRRWKRNVICDTSAVTHYLWHIFSRVNWGENMVNLRDDVERRGRLDSMGFRQRNLMPAGLGWWPLRLSTPYWEATNTDDFEYILAKCAGYDTFFALETDSNALKTHPQTDRILYLVNAWENLRNAGAFTPEQKRLFRIKGLDFRLNMIEPVSTVTPIRTLEREYFIAPEIDQPIAVSVDNPYQSQPLRFKIRVMSALSSRAEDEIRLLPRTVDRLIPGPQEGSLVVESVNVKDGGPAYRFVCDYTYKVPEAKPYSNAPKVRDTQTSPPMRYSIRVGKENVDLDPDGIMVWSSQATTPLDNEELDLSSHRGLGLWLDVEQGSPGATFFVELIDAFGQIRQYYALLEQSGRRWVEWPNGEVSASHFYDYEWARGPDCGYWQALKWFDYSRVTQVRMGVVRVSPGEIVTVVIEGLRALAEVSAEFVQPSFSVGEQTLVVHGKVKSGQYLVYEGGATASVYDANWTHIDDLAISGSTLIPSGDCAILIASNGREPRPWLDVELRAAGPELKVLSERTHCSE